MNNRHLHISMWQAVPMRSLLGYNFNMNQMNSTTAVMAGGTKRSSLEAVRQDLHDMQNDLETSVNPAGENPAPTPKSRKGRARESIAEMVSTTITPVPQEQREYSLRMALAAVKAAAENRGQDILVIDLTQQTSMFDFFVIVTGSSRRQLHAVASEIDRVLRKEMGERRFSETGYDESRWIVQDFGSVVVHLFDEETRSYYDLESLWADGQQVDISEIVSSATAQMTRFSES